MPENEIDPIVIFVAYDGQDAADTAWTKELCARLESQIKGMLDQKLPVSNHPVIKLESVPGFENLPGPETMGYLSLVLLVLPDPTRSFSDPAKSKLQKLAAARAGAEELAARIIPIGREPGRLPPPAPIDDLVGFHASTPLTGDNVSKIALVTLIETSLKASCHQAKFFISYRQANGMAVASRVEQKLTERGYKVWRDDSPDRDGLPHIGLGKKAQESIKSAILSHGFVLLIDTPGTEQRPWVQEEVNTAFGYLLPILPIVVDDSGNYRAAIPKPGGRFGSLESLGRDVRLDAAALGSAATPATNAVVDPKIDQIESEILDVLLGHLSMRRRLTGESRQRFNDLQFDWTERDAPKLLFEASKPAPKPNIPHYTKRILVGCAPYDGLVKQTVENLAASFRAQPVSNGAILVHNAVAYLDQYDSARAGFDYILLLRPHEITAENLP